MHSSRGDGAGGAAQGAARQGGGGDGGGQHHHPYDYLQDAGSLADRPDPPGPGGCQEDAGQDEEDSGADGGDDGHDHGGHHQASVGRPGPTDGQAPGQEEEDGSPDTGGEGNVVVNYPHDICYQGDGSTEYVEATKNCGGRGGVGLPQVRLLRLLLDDIDDLWLWLWLHHFSVSASEQVIQLLAVGALSNCAADMRVLPVVERERLGIPVGAVQHVQIIRRKV